jgi:hypothetical protein
MNFQLSLDHLVIVCSTYEKGLEYCRNTFGVEAIEGGRHEIMGTRNSLLRLDNDDENIENCYLEFISIDSQAPKPNRARWFNLDNVQLQERIKINGPELLHYVLRVNNNDLETLRDQFMQEINVDIGKVLVGARRQPNGKLLEWRIAVPNDGLFIQNGLIPTLIQWKDFNDTHPTRNLPKQGVRLEKFQVMVDSTLASRLLHLQSIARINGPIYEEITDLTSPIELHAKLSCLKGKVLLKSKM